MSDEDISDKHFEFAHKVFSVEGGYFSMLNRKEPVFNAKLGELTAIIDFDRLRAEFGITPDTADGKMLKSIREALMIVKIIKPGDKIPSELLDGTASWNFDPRMREVTKTRVVSSILEWSKTSGGPDLTVPKTSNDDPVDIAFEHLGHVLKVGGNDPRKHIAEMVERMSDELTYIEAIGERLARLGTIRNYVREHLKTASQDAEFGQELMRIDDLIGEPIKGLGGKIRDARTQSFDVLRSFGNFSEHAGYLRGVRDQMRWELMDWDELFDDWAEKTADGGEVTVDLCRRIYRLLAEKYARGQSWGATG